MITTIPLTRIASVRQTVMVRGKFHAIHEIQIIKPHVAVVSKVPTVGAREKHIAVMSYTLIIFLFLKTLL